MVGSWGAGQRHSRYVMLVKVPRKETANVTTALTKHAKKLPKKLYKSLIWDRGMEMSAHKTFTVATDTGVFFCDPYSPWQCGSNENTNRLTIHTFPKVSISPSVAKPN